MQTHLKKRIEIVIEAPLLRRLTERLQAAAVTGYTVMPALSGSGRDGDWSVDGLAGDSGRMVMVLCIVDGAKADAVIEAVYGVVSRQIGLVAMSDVEVVRKDRF